jgi:hypothetical protein
MTFYEFLHEPLALLPERIFSWLTFRQFSLRKQNFGTMLHTFTYPQSSLFIMMETQAATHRCLEPFRWESLRGWDFRPQLIVVSGLFGGNPFVYGILGHNLLLSRTFFTTSSPFYDGILAIKKPFFTNFSFSRWNSGYQEAFFTNFFFFHDGTLAIRKPFSWIFLFHEGTLAIRKLSHEFFFFHDGTLAIRKPFSRIFLFHDGTLAIKKPFSRIFLFSRWNSRNVQFGGKLFSYISQRVFT